MHKENLESHAERLAEAFSASMFQLQAFALSVQGKNDPSSHRLTKLFFLLVAFAPFSRQVSLLFLSPGGFATNDFCRIPPNQKRGSLINTTYKAR